jgi:hypothetical protein
VLLVSTVSFATAATAGASTPSTGLDLISQTGDFVGQGLAYSVPTVTFNPNGSNYSQGEEEFFARDGTDDFTVDLSAVEGSPLVVGTYTGASRFSSPTSPGLDIFGDARGCDTTTGSFTVYDATYDSSGTPLSFAAEFDQHCEGATPALFGTVRFNSAVTMPTLPAAQPNLVINDSANPNFGSVRVGDASDPLSVTMTNTGSGTEAVSGFAVSGDTPDDFVVDSDCTSLTTGQSCTIQVTFLPGAAGVRSAVISPTGTEQNPPSISVQGTGTIGFYEAGSDGSVYDFGDADDYGDASGLPLAAPIVSMVATPGGYGYWLLGADGGIFSFGDAQFYGSTGATRLNKPVVGLAPTPDGGGYWLVASDGGIFSFGDAQFYGSTGAIRLNKPIIGMAPTPDGGGYWLVASDGGIFSFGDAQFYGSTGAIRLTKPIVGLAATPDGGGYWLVASDGGIFSFGDAQFYGSTGATRLTKPIVGIAPTPDGGGYWLVAADGAVFSFGDAATVENVDDSPIDNIVAISGTAPPTVQSLLGIPAIRHR